MIAMPSFYSSFTVLSHMPSYKFADSPPLPDQKTRCAFQQQVSLSYPLHWLPPDSRCSPRHHTPSFAACFPLVVWSDRHGFRGNEVGSLQPNSVPFRGHMNHFVVRNFFAFGHMLDRAGEREGDA